MKTFSLPFWVFIAIIAILTPVQLTVDNSLILLERFISGGGWFEIAIISFYGAYVAYKMQDPALQSKWRLKTWTIFSLVFFIQLILGIAGFDSFLMTGELHMPIPMMILGGPVYRAEISFMPILFLSTIVLSGPAWCSQLCYFGALDGWFSKGKRNKKMSIKRFTPIKIIGVLIIITVAIILRIFNVPILYSSVIAGVFAIVGVLIMVIYSKRLGKMVHCTTYCPIGTIVNYLKYINPFRFRIDMNCTSCMLCIPECKYGALDKEAIINKKPGITCTLCGDCISVCKPDSFYYKFPGLGPTASRNLYLGVTITLHAVFLALARM